MDRKKLTLLTTGLVQRIRNYPEPALKALFEALDAIERKYDLIEHLSEEERRAVEEGIASLDRGETVPLEDIEIFKRLKDFDRDAAGKEDFADALSRVQKLSGEEQADIADVIFALLDEYRYDFGPPPKTS